MLNDSIHHPYIESLLTQVFFLQDYPSVYQLRQLILSTQTNIVFAISDAAASSTTTSDSYRVKCMYLHVHDNSIIERQSNTYNTTGPTKLFSKKNCRVTFKQSPM